MVFVLTCLYNEFNLKGFSNYYYYYYYYLPLFFFFSLFFYSKISLESTRSITHNTQHINISKIIIGLLLPPTPIHFNSNSNLSFPFSFLFFILIVIKKITECFKSKVKKRKQATFSCCCFLCTTM